MSLRNDNIRMMNGGEVENLGDISKVASNDIPDCDLVTYGFPCQDVSIAGNQKGIVAGQTRSGLLYEALRIIEAKKPSYAICENVKNLVGKKFKPDFDKLLFMLDELGYNSYWQVLNAKDYGIPQNRERVFVISIRKDIDNGTFKFPEKFPLELRLKDMLENEVDEKFFIKKALNFSFKDKYIQYDNSSKGYNSQAARLYYQDGLCPTQPHNNSGDKTQVVLMNKIDVFTLLDDTQGFDDTRVYKDYSPTLRAARSGLKVATDFRIRKLTPKECWRLMGFDDSDFDKAKAAGISASQLYKQAGNSIVVNVLQYIFRNLFKGDEVNEA